MTNNVLERVVNEIGSRRCVTVRKTESVTSSSEDKNRGQFHNSVEGT